MERSGWWLLAAVRIGTKYVRKVDDVPDRKSGVHKNNRILRLFIFVGKKGESCSPQEEIAGTSA